MNHVHLDTGYLIDTLKEFSDGGNFSSDERAIDAIDLLCHLLCRKTLIYDAAVFGDQRKELANTLEAVSGKLSRGAREVWEKKFQPKAFDEEKEISLIKTAVLRTAENAARLRADLPRLDQHLQKCNAIRSADKFTKSVQSVLLPHLDGRRPPAEVDAIATDKGIAGRRFIWAILKDDEIATKFRKAAAGLPEQVSDAVPDRVKLFKLLFSQFRGEFAVERNRQLSDDGTISEGSIFYAPGTERAAVLESALHCDHAIEALRASEDLSRVAETMWFKRRDKKKAAYLPLPLLFLLTSYGQASLKPMDLLSYALEQSMSEEARKLGHSLNSLSTEFIGHHDPKKFIKMFEEDFGRELTGRDDFSFAGAKEENETLWALILLFLSPTPGQAAGLATAAVKFGPWCFRFTRLRARELVKLLPPQRKEPMYVDRFREVFSRNPPER